jgi:transposase
VLLNPFDGLLGLAGVMSDRFLVSDEVWSVIGPLFPAWKGNGRPVADRRLVVEGTAWKFRTGAPWRDLPEHFGNWNTVFKNFDRWAKDGTWTKVLEHVQTRAESLGDLDWVASIDSTIVRVHQHGATLPRLTGGPLELHETRNRTS